MSNTARTSTASRRIKSAIAGIGVVALGVGGVSTLAAVAAPGDIAEARGQFLSGAVGGTDLGAIAEITPAEAGYPSNPEDSNPLTAEVLNAIALELPGEIPLFSDTGIIQLGAVAQFAQATADADAYAASGAVVDTGALGFEIDEDADYANATVDLTPLLSSDLIETLGLEIGALAANAAEVDGAVTSEYHIGSLVLDLESPAISEIYTLLGTALTTLQGSVDALEEGIEANIDIDLPIGVGLAVDVQLAVPSLASLLPGAIVNANGVTVDLSNGTVSVDIEQVLADEGLDINDLDPNTPLLTGAVLDAVVDAIVSAVTSILSGVVTNLTADDLLVSGNVTLDLLALPDVVLALSGTVADPEATVDLGIIGDLLDEVLALLGLGDVAAIEALVEGLLETALGTLGTDLATAFTTLGSTVSGITDVLEDERIDPIFGVINGIVALTANVQPTSAPINAPGGDLGDDSFTVRALQIGLLPVAGAPFAATVNLASATVQGEIAVADVDADTEADADAPADAETDADADVDTDAPVDADVDVDGPADADVLADADITADDPDADADADAVADADADADADAADDGLANTGFNGTWLGGFALLILLSGAGLLLARKVAQN